MRSLITIVLAALIGSAGQIAMAKDHDEHGDKHWKDRDDDDRERHHKYGESCFRAEHLQMIHDHYRPRALPPGLEKKFYRTGHLPPGWEKKIQPFPYSIERRLPPLPPECARGYMDGYAIVYQPRSRVIIDIHAVVAP
jgi:hypothetical protein